MNDLNQELGFERKGISRALFEDHKELLRQAWVLFMLDLRREWFDGKTIQERTGELEIALRKHLRVEAPSKEDYLVTLVEQIRDLPPMSEEWDAVFEEFEATLQNHVRGNNDHTGANIQNEGDGIDRDLLAAV